MESNAKWVFAWSKTENRAVHISEVPNGNDCNCRCFCCKGDMQARQGNERVHHFKHINTEYENTCSAERCNETALHKIAKEILSENSAITLPDYSIKVGKF
jgi:competence CoiA-like predicted nuclease